MLNRIILNKFFNININRNASKFVQDITSFLKSIFIT